jgi:hypothetical protein
MFVVYPILLRIGIFGTFLLNLVKFLYGFFGLRFTLYLLSFSLLLTVR